MAVGRIEIVLGIEDDAMKFQEPLMSGNRLSFFFLAGREEILGVIERPPPKSKTWVHEVQQGIVPQP